MIDNKTQNPELRLIETVFAVGIDMLVPGRRKMRSLLQSQERLIEGKWSRPRSRDYYDLWRLITEFGLV
jgi:hypothetical protein